MLQDPLNLYGAAISNVNTEDKFSNTNESDDIVKMVQKVPRMHLGCYMEG